MPGLCGPIVSFIEHTPQFMAARLMQTKPGANKGIDMTGHKETICQSMF